ncbi:MAG: hypothetical protein ABL893_04715 [Hyphomicrobium sp.]|nr:hypothetical protein [Hyphomicrobium sp.]
MSKSSINIQPIDFDAATRAVERFSKDRHIPSMTYPGEGEGPTVETPKATEVTTLPVLQTRRSIKRIPVELPDYVVEDVKRRALDGNCSARHIIMRALRAYGVHIADEDMPEDGRRNR